MVTQAMEKKTTRSYALTLVLSVCAFIGFVLPLKAQPLVLNVDDVPLLVREVLFDGDNSLKAFNIKYTGDKRAIGVFTNNGFTKALWSKAIVMSTGQAYSAATRNMAEGTGSNLRSKGSAQLSAIAKNASFDACIIEFDFTTDYDSIYFEYFFASEEYPEFVNRGVNDVFGFFIQKKGEREWQNIARLPVTQEPITIDNVNHRKNAAFYRPNPVYIYDASTVMDISREAVELSYSLCFDGMTIPLAAGLRVEPGATYRFRMAISDVGDGVYDSAVFLRAGSFGATKAVGGNVSPIRKSLQKLVNEVPGLTYNDGAVYLNVLFDFDSSILPADEQERIEAFVKQLYEVEYASLKVRGHTDDKGSEAYNASLSKRRADAVRDYMISLGISEMNISSEGVGELEPLVDNTTDDNRAKNRRVEFVFEW